MIHGCSDHEWSEWACGELRGRRALEFEQHLRACGECRGRSAELAGLDAMFSDMASKLKAATPVSGADIQEALFRWERQTSPSRRVEYLRVYLSRVCGTHIAGRALGLAAKEAKAELPELVESGQWRKFIASLSEIVGGICGEPAVLLLQSIASGI